MLTRHPFVDFAAHGGLDFHFLGRGAEAMSSRVAFRAASEAWAKGVRL
jgi:hypothetical protein